MPRTVMIVDDSLFMRNILRGMLVEQGYVVDSEAASGIEVMRNLHNRHPDFILLDIILPDSNDLDLLESIIKTCPNTRVVVCSSLGQETVISKAMEMGAAAFIQKPFTPGKVADVLKSLED